MRGGAFPNRIMGDPGAVVDCRRTLTEETVASPRVVVLGGGVAAALGALALTTAAFTGCKRDEPPAGAPTPTRFFDSTLADRRFRVAEHMLASVEMQISGEP